MKSEYNEEQIFELIKSPDLEVRRLGCNLLKQTKFYKAYKYTRISKCTNWGYTIRTYINDFYHDFYWNRKDIIYYIDLIEKLWERKKSYL